MPLMIIIISSHLLIVVVIISSLYTTENQMRLHQENLENFQVLNKYLWLLIIIQLQMLPISTEHLHLDILLSQSVLHIRTSFQILSLSTCYITSVSCLKKSFNFLLHCQLKTKSSCFYFPQHHIQIEKLYFPVPTLDYL